MLKKTIFLTIFLMQHTILFGTVSLQFDHEKLSELISSEAKKIQQTTIISSKIITCSIGCAVAAPLLVIGMHHAVDATFPKIDAASKRKNAATKASCDIILATAIIALCLYHLK